MVFTGDVREGVRTTAKSPVFAGLFVLFNECPQSLAEVQPGASEHIQLLAAVGQKRSLNLP